MEDDNQERESRGEERETRRGERDPVTLNAADRTALVLFGSIARDPTGSSPMTFRSGTSAAAIRLTHPNHRNHELF